MPIVVVFQAVFLATPHPRLILSHRDQNWFSYCKNFIFGTRLVYIIKSGFRLETISNLVSQSNVRMRRWHARCGAIISNWKNKDEFFLQKTRRFVGTLLTFCNTYQNICFKF
ncbi:hypothetical protein QTP88_019355 [Uroleucon formosanum]